MNIAFKIAILISIAVHGAILAPYALFHQNDNYENLSDVNINYIIIQKPELAVEEENMEESVKIVDQYSSLKRDEVLPLKQHVLSLQKEESKPEELSAEPVEEQIKVLEIDQTALLEYYNLIREKIRAEMYKSSGRKKGEVTIIFTISPNGDLLNIDSIQTGQSSFSNRMTRSIHKVTPFPPFPKEFGLQPITFSLTVKLS